MSTQIIKLNRGDSWSKKVNIPYYENGETYILTTSDVLYFALLYPHQPFEEAILLKGYTLEDQDVETGELILSLTPNETRCLAPGIYYYTTKLQRGGTLESVGDFDEPTEVRTIIERTKFIINE